MNMDDLLESISESIDETGGGVKFRRLLFDNKRLTRNQPVDSEFITTSAEQVSLSNNEKIIQVLVEFFESESKDYPQKQLIVATLQGDLEATELLLKSGKIKLEGTLENWEYYSLPALYSSVLYRKTETRMDMLRLLIKHGLNVNIVSSEGDNIYHALSDAGDAAAELAKILFESGLTVVERVGQDGTTPLHNAILLKNIGLVEFFIDKGADVIRSEDIVNYFPLTRAFIYANEEIIDILVANGADVNARDKNFGWTALHYLCNGNKLGAIKLALKKGADVNVEDEDGKTPVLLLDLNDSSYPECMITMIRALAKSTTISKTNMDYVQSHTVEQKLFQKYSKGISLLKSLVFYAPHSYYSVLGMRNNLKKLAKLTMNDDFVAAFKNNLTSFTLYRDDLRVIFKDAVRVRDELLRIRCFLKTGFGDFLPDVVLDNVAKNLSIRDVKFE